MKHKKLLIISIIIILIVIVIGIIGFIYYKKHNEYKEPIITIKENNNYEINSEINIESILDTTENIELINGSELIDTSKVGNNEITIKYKNLINNTEEEKKVEINIVDTIKPVIEVLNKEIITEQGINIDIKSNAKIFDNSNETLDIEIEGTYDINVVGEYNLKYTTKDNSGNIAVSEEFKLIVKEKEVKQENNTISKNNTSSNSNSNKNNVTNTKTQNNNSNTSNNSANSNKGQKPTTPRPSYGSVYNYNPNDGWDYSHRRFWYVCDKQVWEEDELVNVHWRIVVEQNNGTTYDFLDQYYRNVEKALGTAPSLEQTKKMLTGTYEEKREKLSTMRYGEKTLYLATKIQPWD